MAVPLRRLLRGLMTGHKCLGYDNCDLGRTLGYSGRHHELVVFAVLEARAPPFQNGQRHAVPCAVGRLRSDVTGHRRECRNFSIFFVVQRSYPSVS